MPSLCQYRGCQNLGSSTYSGYCNEYHFNLAFIELMEKDILPVDKFCKYKMCHNLASRTWSGYCDKNHYEKGVLESGK